MKLITDWKQVLRKAWSVRLLGIAAVLSGVEAALPHLEAIIEMPRGLFAFLSFVSTCTAFAARLIAQRSMEDDLPEDPRTEG